jgi:hypothetical protein
MSESDDFRDIMIGMAVESTAIIEWITTTVDLTDTASPGIDITARFAHEAAEDLAFFDLTTRRDADEVVVTYLTKRIEERRNAKA